MQWALGSAGIQASGLKASFGTMGKHLNAGNAAAAGVLSARLAQADFTGAPDVIESPQGFAFAHNPAATDFDATRAGASLGERLAVERIMYKLHAACGGTHSAINGIRAIRAPRPFTIDEVDVVELRVCDKLLQICCIPEPQTGPEGMFSIRYAATLALMDRDTGPRSFSDEAVRDAVVVAARARVRLNPTRDIPSITTPTEVTVRLTNGEVLDADSARLTLANLQLTMLQPIHID
jgi:2-methylcitrate dehydratase PrpD